MKTHPGLLEIESANLRHDARWAVLAKALTLAMASMPKNPPTAFLDDCRLLDTKLDMRGRYLASLN